MTETVPLTVEPHAHCVERVGIVLDSPQRWTLDDPHQYLVRCELVEEGLPCDCIETRFGIRKAEPVRRMEALPGATMVQCVIRGAKDAVLGFDDIPLRMLLYLK